MKEPSWPAGLGPVREKNGKKRNRLRRGEEKIQKPAEGPAAFFGLRGDGCLSERGWELAEKRRRKWGELQ